jgi:hypothetical protein
MRQPIYWVSLVTAEAFEEVNQKVRQLIQVLLVDML